MGKRIVSVFILLLSLALPAQAEGLITFGGGAERSVTAADGYPELTRICKVAGLGGEPYRDGSYDYYVHETVCSGDTKGTAPFLMACCALEV